MTMGSLFSGAGGFELAGRNSGIRTLWQSEIEPFCRLVESKNFPEAEPLGDITKISGTGIQPVDIITGGSPCQDMSIAGARAGISGSRSCLFYEQIRIVKEMYNRCGKPRFMVWENVPGVFSSNKGQDFQFVLTETIKIAEPDAPDVPVPEKGWPYAGCLMGGCGQWSVAWRILDAQYCGVPQRRRRIYLVADFGGASAGEILFKQRMLPRDAPEGRREKQTAGCRAGNNPESTVKVIDNHPGDARAKICEDGICPTLCARMGMGGNNQPLIMDTAGKTIRRITPLECCRLQGFPDSWAEGLEILDPSGCQLNYWCSVWYESGRPKTKAQTARWLKHPTSDSVLYRMWGNSLAVPCAEFVMGGIRSIVGIK